MKFNAVLELAKISVNEFIALLQKETVLNSLNRRVIVECNETHKLERLRELFTSEISSETAECLYLNQQIDQMIELKAPVLENLDFVLKPSDILIIPITPLTIVHHSRLSKIQLLIVLRALQQFLQKKSEKLLCGWELTALNEYDYFSNTSTGIDWFFFHPFVKLITPKGEKDSLLFNMTLEEHPYDRVKCYLTPKQFVTLQKLHGLNTLAETTFSQNIAPLIVPQDTDTVRLKTIKKMLTPKNEIKDTLSACIAVHTILSKRPLEGLSDTEAQFYDNLGMIYNPVQHIVEINSKITVNLNPIEINTAAPLGIDNASNHTAIAVKPVSSSLSKRLLQLLKDIELQTVLLEETLLTVPTLTDPFKAEDEMLICEILQNKNPLILKLGELAKDKTFSSEDRIHLLNWVKSNLHTLTNIVEKFSILQFRLSTYELTKQIIELLMSLRYDVEKRDIDYLNAQIHLFKEALLNACLYSGQYELVHSWLDIFATIPCPLSENTAYHFYYSTGLDCHYRFLVAQLTGDLDTAITLGNQNKVFIESAFSLLLQQYGKNKKSGHQRSKPQISYDPNSATLFLQATKKYISLYALSHLSFSTELIHSNRFLEACESLKVVANDLEGITTYNEIVARIKSEFNLIIDSSTKKKKSHPSHELTTTKTRWCSVRHYLKMKRALQNHLPAHFILTEKNESITLTAKKESQAKALFLNLKKHSITCTLDKKSIHLALLTSTPLDNLKKALQVPMEKYTTHPDSIPPKTETTREELLFRSLKNLHYKYFGDQKKVIFDVLNEELKIFLNQCKNPSTRIKTLLMLVSLHLSSSFTHWSSGQYQESEKFFTETNNYANSAYQLLEKLSNTEHYTEAAHLCWIIKEKLESHLDITTQVVFTSFLKSSSEYLTSLKLTLAGKANTFFWCQVGVNNLLTFYKNSEEIRVILARKPVCFDVKDYINHEKLLVESTQLCFEAAYELLTETALARIEGNSPEIAMERAQTAYNSLCELRDHYALTLPAHIRSYILVLKTIFEPNLDLTKALSHLNEALKTANTHPNIIHKIEILLRKIDWISNNPIDSKIESILGEMTQLYHYLRSLKPGHATIFSNQIMITVQRYFFLFFSLNIPIINLLSSFPHKDAIALHEITLSIVNHMENTLLIKDGSDFAISSFDNINTLKMIIKIRMLLISHSALERRIRNDLYLESQYSDNIHLLIPKMIITFSDLLRYDDHLISPHSPLIRLAVACQQMMNYSSTEEKSTDSDIQSLASCYKTVAELTINTLPMLLQEQFKPFCEPEQNVMHSFQQLITLVNCLNDAHVSNARKIHSDNVTLIRKMSERLPDNMYIAYTLYKVLSDNNSSDIQCPDAIEACRKAADAGHPHAQFYYSKILDNGYFGSPINREKAQDYLQLSLEQDYYRAQIRIAKLYKSGLFGKSEYTEECAQHYAEAAMSNAEIPDSKKQHLHQEHDVIYIPNQLY